MQLQTYRIASGKIGFTCLFTESLSKTKQSKLYNRRVKRKLRRLPDRYIVYTENIISVPTFPSCCITLGYLKIK